MRIRATNVFVALVVMLAACDAEDDDAVRAGTPTNVTLVPATTATSTTTSTTSTTLAAEPEIVVPAGILAAVPYQNRLDVPKGIFQLKLYNGTDELLPVVGVQLVWDGLTTPVSDRVNNLAGGDRVDYPVQLATATCAGDGSVADMPDLKDAVARVLLSDGREMRVPVYDVHHFARKLYLQDCERQLIASQVQIEWVDLHQTIFEGRPVTEGKLHLTRLSGTGAVTVLLVSNTVLFTFTAPAPLRAESAVAVLPSGQQTGEARVRFIEGRCDAHAMAEASQPFEFGLLLDLGDGSERPYALPIPEPDQVPMRSALEAACEILGKTGALG